MKALVVGAGIIGCSLAHALRRRGHEVVLVDAGDPAGGTTGTSYAWINSHRKHPLAYHAINLAGVGYWTELIAPRHAKAVTLAGHLEVAEAEPHRASLRERVDRLQGLGYPAEWITAKRGRELAPITVPDGASVAHFPTEGIAYPVTLCRALLAEMADTPEFTLARGRVVQVDADAPAVKLATGERLGADVVAICAGNGSTALAESAGARLPLVDQRVAGAAFGYLGYVTAAAHGLVGPITTDLINVRPDGPDQLIVQSLDLDVTANPTAAVAGDVTEELQRRLTAVLPAGGTVREVRVGHRVIPEDGLTAAGPLVGDPPAGSARGLPPVWAVLTHSGVVLGPWLGHVVAAEMSGEPAEPLLEAFRPARFAEQATAAVYAAPRAPGEQ